MEKLPLYTIIKTLTDLQDIEKCLEILKDKIDFYKTEGYKIPSYFLVARAELNKKKAD